MILEYLFFSFPFLLFFFSSPSKSWGVSWISFFLFIISSDVQLGCLLAARLPMGGGFLPYLLVGHGGEREGVSLLSQSEWLLMAISVLYFVSLLIVGFVI
jgi:hypothetical protein